MGNFGDYEVALEVRDIIAKMTSAEIEKLRPRYQMAIVVSIDRVGRKCEVQFPGDTTTVWVKMGSIQPSTAGQTVRVAGVQQDRYIDDVIGVPWIEGLVEDLGNEVADKIKTHYSPSGSPRTATAVGDLWVVTDLGALFRWDGDSWEDTGLASEIGVRSRGADLITNGTGYMLNNTNFPWSTFNATDYPAGVFGSFRTPLGVQSTYMVVDKVPFNPKIRYRFSFQARQVVAGNQGRMYGFIVPYDRLGNIIEPAHYMFITGTTTTLAATLNPGATTIQLTSSANWYGSAGKPAGASSFQRRAVFWNYTDSLGKAWGTETYSRTLSPSDAWADGGISGNVITLRTPWAGPSIPAGTAVSNATSGNSYIYMPSCSNVIVPETWTTYADTFDDGVMLAASQSVVANGSATWTLGLPPGTSQLGVGWIVNQSVGGSQHAIAGVSVSESAAATQATIDQAVLITDLQDDLTGVTGQLDGKSTIYVQTTAPTGLDAQDQGDIWINSSTADRVAKVWDGDSWENITDQATLDVLATVNTKITTFYASTAPTATPIGDLWIDSDDKRLYRATAVGSSNWVEVTDNRLAQATSDIATIQSDLTGLEGQLDGKSTIYVQTTAPTGLDAQDQGDIWINTSTTDRIPSVWDGDSWELITDAASIEALALVQTKITTFYQSEPPTAETEGDLWIDTNDDNKLYRWSAPWGSTDRTNIVQNPSPVVNRNGWGWNGGSAGASATQTTVAADGSLVANGKDLPYVRSTITNAGSGSLNQTGPIIGSVTGREIPIDAPLIGQPITFSIYVRDSRADRTTNLWARFYNSSNGSLGGPITPSTPVAVGGGWTRISGTYTVPAGADHLRIVVQAQGGTLIAVGDTIDIGGALIELGSTLQPYFDGSMPPATWSGTAYASFSNYSAGWIAVDDLRIAALAADLVTVQGELTGLSGQVDGKSTVYVQGTQPHDSNLATDTGDVWIDTANGRIIKTYDGSNWNVSDDTRLALALSTANSKITTYYSSTAPTGTLADGDLWVKTGTNLIYRYKLSTTTWEPLPVTAGSMSPELTWMAGQKLYDTFSDFSAWSNSGGTVTVQQTSQAETGGYVFQIVGQSTLVRNGVNGQLIPFDPNVLYRVTWRVRQTVNPSSGGSLVYLGVAGYAADGTTLVNITGADSTSSQHYVCAAAEQIVVADGWKTFTGFIKGRSTSGTSSKRVSPIAPGVVHTNVRYIRPIAYVNMASGNGTAQLDLVTVEVVEVGSVAGDNLQVGSVSPEKIAMWAYNKNLVPDPSFEETYPLVAPVVGFENRWRTSWILGNGYVERFRLPHSGEWAARLGVTGSGSNSAALYAGNFPVIPGNTYNVQIAAAKEHPTVDSNFYMRVAGGSTDALTEYPGAPFTSVIPFNGEVPDFAADLDLQWVGQNLYPNQNMIDSNSDGIHDSAEAYSSGSVTTGARTVTEISTGSETYKQNLTAASMAVSSRWGTVTKFYAMEKNRSHKIEFDYTLSGTNARLRLYVDTYDEDGTIQQQGLGVTESAASGRVSFTLAAHATAVEYRVYVWIEPAAGLTATSPSASWSQPLLYKIDTSGMVDPDTPGYQTISGSFTVPAGIYRASLHLMINQPAAAQSIFLDDITVLEAGQGGSELTAAGLRLFNTDGEEAVALVANRKNFFSVQRKGVSLASIDEEGKGTFQAVSIAGTDTDDNGVPDKGFEIFGTEFKDWIDSVPRGVVAWEDFGTDKGPYNTETGFGEIAFDAEPGRLYRVGWRGNVEHSVVDGLVSVKIRYTVADRPSDAAGPTISSNTILYTLTSVSGMTAGWDETKGDSKIFYNQGTTTKHVRFLLTIAPYSAGNAYFRSLGAGAASLDTGSDQTAGTLLYVEDVGPYRAQAGSYNLGGAGGGSTPPPVTTYVKTWTSTTACCYMGSGAKDSSQGASDMKQGYSSYDGDSRSLWIFPSMTSTLSGATITKIRVYLYANHWYYNSGGTAKIKAHGYTSVPASSPSMTSAVTSSSWPKPGGRWVTLPSSFHAGFLAGTYRGIGVGPAGTTNLLYYGKFNKAGAKIEITYKK